MTNFLSLKNVMVCFILAFGFTTAFGQLFSYTFADSTQSRADWVGGGTNTGTEVWGWYNDPSLATFTTPVFGAPTAANGFMMFNSDANAANAHDVTLTGPTFSCASSTNTRVSFWTQYAWYTAGALAELQVSTDGGTTWTPHTLFATLAANTMANSLVTVAIPEANGKATVKLRFRWKGNYDYAFKVDDIKVENVVVAPTPVTFSVNMSTQTVDPAGAFIAGAFNSWTGEAMTNMGNGIWSITKNLAPGTYQYKFKNGASIWENAPAACGVADGNGGFNRQVVVGAMASTVGPFCLNSCTNCAAPVVPCDMNPMAIICDNFDSYNTTMTTGTQGPNYWTTWSGTTGTTEDGKVSTVHAASAPNSMYIKAVAAGGPQDVVLKFGNKTTGNYSLKHKFYIPTAKAAYYNIQNVVPIGAGAWNADVLFNADGTGDISVTQVIQATFTYPKDKWFTVEHKIDLDNNLAALYVDGVFVNKMAFPNNLGGIDYFGINATHEFWVDDVEFVQLPAVVYNVDACDGAVDITSLFGFAPGVPQLTALQNNTTATTTATDVAGSCWNEPTVSNSMWYTFTGDGDTYHLETVPCSATSYIDDTQMAIFSGSCGNLTEVACGDDLYSNGNPDWRAGLDFETVAGVNYLVMIDGFDYNGTIAVGEYCLSVDGFASVDCTAGAVGTLSIANDGFICQGGNLSDNMIVDPASFVLPNNGPVAGMCWAITSEPVPANAWPGTIAGIASTGFSGSVGLVNLPNTGANFPYGIYYLTPIVVGGGTLIDPAALARVFNVNDPSTTGGCYFVGESQLVVLLDVLPPLAATGTVVNDNGTGVGGINLTPSGGFAALLGQDSWNFNWSNGATTEDVAGLTTGSYTVTVSDITNCVDEVIATFMVGTTSASDPASLVSLTISPNPTNGLAMVALNLEAAADVRIEMVNTIGQVIQTQNLGTVQAVNQTMDFSALSSGIYMMRVTIDGQSAVRAIAINR